MKPTEKENKMNLADFLKCEKVRCDEICPVCGEYGALMDLDKEGES